MYARASISPKRDFDTSYTRTHTVVMNTTIHACELTVARARKKAEALGKSLNQLIHACWQGLAGDYAHRSSMEEFRRLSGKGNSHAQRLDRDEAHLRKI